MINTNFKLGILGGGQLGKMLAQAASPWDLTIWAMDLDKSFPAGPHVSHFVEGNFKDYEAVLAFGKQVDVLTIEIEHVDTQALHELVAMGKKVHPAPEVLDIIKDKGLQKLFYQKHNLPTSPFQLYDDKEAVRRAIASGELSIPFVQKSREAGYDGKGVAVIRTASDLTKVLSGPCMIESLVDIDLEIAVQVCRNENGDVAVYPAVGMEFHPEANLVEYLFSPSSLSPTLEKQAQELAVATAEAYNVCGLLSVELFLDKKGNLLINEVAPRPHNSGHHTIESNYTSQFQQHIRGVLNLPLGSTKMKTPAVMVNLLGAEGHTGDAVYQGLFDCLKIEGAYLHIYGKTQTKPFRKMGHATVIADSVEEAKSKAALIKNTLKIIT